MSGFANLLRWQLRRERARLAILALATGVFMGLIVAISDVIEPEGMAQMMEMMPRGLKALVGLAGKPKLTIDVWLGLAHNHPLWMTCSLLFPILVSLRAIDRGIADGTLEVVLAQPITRTTYYLSVAATLLIGCTVVFGTSAGAALLAGRLTGQAGAAQTAPILRLSLSGWCLAMSIGGLGLLCSAGALGRRPGGALVGVVLGSYFAHYLARIWPAASWLRSLSVFGYHDPQRILRDGLMVGHVAALLGVAVLSAVVGAAVFNRRQLTF